MPRHAKPTAESLPEAELEILAFLHRHGEADILTIRSAIDSFRPLTHASVSTLVRRLEARGLVTRRTAERGKAFLYSAAVAPEETYGGVVSRLVERVFRNDRLGVVASLFSGKPPTRAEVRELKRLVNKLHGPKKR